MWATGNGGNNCDHCGADGYVASIYSLSIQSMSDFGELPYFGERCTSTMAAVPAGGEPTRKMEIAGRMKIKVVCPGMILFLTLCHTIPTFDDPEIRSLLKTL